MSDSVWIAAIALAAGLSAPAAEPVAWGSVASEVRLGISFGDAGAEPELHVFLENLGPTARQILIGSQVKTGISVSLRFYATAPDGTKHEGFEINSFTPIAGLLTPVVIRIEPGGTYQMRFLLKNIVCIQKPGDVRFDALMKQGASVRVSLEKTDDRSAQWAGLSGPVIDTIESGELLPPK